MPETKAKGETVATEISIGVVIALYNGAEHIRAALESATNQSLPPASIVVVDDGSTDNGSEIVQAFIDENHAVQTQVTLIRQSNAGQGNARNAGVNFLDCDFVAFLDQDDYWGAHHLFKLYSKFDETEDSSLGWVYSDFNEVDGTSRVIKRRFLHQGKYIPPESSIFAFLRQDLMMLPSAALIKRSAFVNIDGFDGQFRGYEDDDLFVRLFLSGAGFAYLQDSETYYRIHGGNSSGSSTFYQSRERFYFKMISVFEEGSEYQNLLKSRYLGPRILWSYFVDGYTLSLTRNWEALATMRQSFKSVFLAQRRQLGLIKRSFYSVVIWMYGFKLTANFLGFVFKHVARNANRFKKVIGANT